MKGRYDALHGDEPEIDALANRAEAMRDVDVEIDRQKERYAALDPQTVNDAVVIQQTAIRMIRKLAEMAEWPIGVCKRDADILSGYNATICNAIKEMSK